MSLREISDPVLYFASFLFNQNIHDPQEIKEWWSLKFPNSTYFSTDYSPLEGYYSSEMGDTNNLSRFFLFSHEKKSREHIVPLKIWANQQENIWSDDLGHRKVNIDVGYLAKEQLVLATGKPFTHRIYLSRGVYLDLTLIYQKKTFQALPWTYPDYAEEQKIQFFNQHRQNLF
jgi:hypothetical protein